MAVTSDRQRAAIYEGTRIPHPIPTVLRVSQELRGTGDLMTVNFGPNHPSTHGVLRLIVDLFGEDVVGIEAVIGYLHTGFEKNMEQKTWWKAITYAPRIDYLSFQNNELVFVLAAEKLLAMEVPEKVMPIRSNASRSCQSAPGQTGKTVGTGSPSSSHTCSRTRRGRAETESRW